MTDKTLIERLRGERLEWEYHSNPPRKVAVSAGLRNPDGPEAADELERLQALAQAKDEALRDIMDACHRRQLPLTDQIYRRAEVALSPLQPTDVKDVL